MQTFPRRTVFILFLTLARITTTSGQTTSPGQPNYPTPVEGDYKVKNFQFVDKDPNDMIYAFDASRDYDPSPYLSKIKAPLFAVNSADDEVSPPELGIMEREIKKVAKGRYILLPITDQTSGHGTHSNPTIWGDYLKELLEISAK